MNFSSCQWYQLMGKVIAKQDIFNYIEMFYNSVRGHTANDLLSPHEFERRHKKEAEKCLLN